MNVAVKLPRQLTMAPADFAPRAIACKRNYGNGPCNRGIACESRDPPKCLAVDGLSADTDGVSVDLNRLETDIARKPLDEIAAAVRKLTYGEFMTLAAGIWESNGKQSITEDMLPVVLHRWATGQERK